MLPQINHAIYFFKLLFLIYIYYKIIYDAIWRVGIVLMSFFIELLNNDYPLFNSKLTCIQIVYYAYTV